MSAASTEPVVYTDFIQDIVEEDIKTNKWGGRVHTRFPPEPNGYLHIGHVRAIDVDFGIAEDFNGKCNLRFDDTNPVKEDVEYVESIMEDIRWLGFDWEDRMFYASDYFQRFYAYAVQLIKKGKAYVCDLSEEDIRKYRGTVKKPGKLSPYRDRSIEENLDLFERMRSGEFKDGARVLRAKIDMASPNMKMRDPIIYRIRHAKHHRTGDKWCIYPIYDFAHCLSDSIEKITHSFCSLEFDNNRELYDWYLDQLEVYHPQQIEFARLNITYTIMSKRKLRNMVEDGYISGWDDPRMPTLCGLRRRGYTPESIRKFIRRVGVGRSDSSIADVALLEYSIKEELNKTAPRVMVVLRPLKVIIDNYPEDKVEMLEAINNPEDLDAGTREVPFSRVIYIEKDDFREEPPKKWFRLSHDKEVRLKHAYFIKVVDVIKDDNGEVVELHCTYDPASRGGESPDGRKVRGTLHWVSAQHAIGAEVRLFERLFKVPDPANEEGDFKDYINPNSLEILTGCKLEPGLAKAKPGERYQFMRKGYFYVDQDSTKDKLVFNRTVTLRDSWAKIEKKQKRK